MFKCIYVNRFVSTERQCNLAMYVTGICCCVSFKDFHDACGLMTVDLHKQQRSRSGAGFNTSMYDGKKVFKFPSKKHDTGLSEEPFISRAKLAQKS